MLTRAAALLVLLAALLQAAPVAPSAVSIRWSAAVASVRADRRPQPPRRAKAQPASKPVAQPPAGPTLSQTFPGHAAPHFQRPPPALS